MSCQSCGGAMHVIYELGRGSIVLCVDCERQLIRRIKPVETSALDRLIGK